MKILHKKFLGVFLIFFVLQPCVIAQQLQGEKSIGALTKNMTHKKNLKKWVTSGVCFAVVSATSLFFWHAKKNKSSEVHADLSAPPMVAAKELVFPEGTRVSNSILGEYEKDPAIEKLKLQDVSFSSDISKTYDCNFTSIGENIVGKWPNLTELNLNGNKEITKAWLKNLNGLPKLTVLKLGRTNIEEGWLTDLDFLNNLTTLDVSSCTNMSLQLVEEIFAKAQNLKKLEFGGPIITGEELKELTKNDNLIELHFDFCPELTKNGLEKILKATPNLTGLDVSGCAEIIDDGLQVILVKTPNLTELNLSGCTQLTEAGLQNILKKTPNLTKLILYRCPQITDKMVQTIQNARKDLGQPLLDIRGGSVI